MQLILRACSSKLCHPNMLLLSSWFTSVILQMTPNYAYTSNAGAKL